MGSNSGKVPEYPTTTLSSDGLFGTTTTNQFGSSFEPTAFQTQLTNNAQSGALNSFNEFLNPNYDSAEFKQGDEYYKKKMYNKLQNDYLNPALSNNLLRGSTANDVMRGFANDLADNEYARQLDYKNQQLQNYQTAMLGYNNMYDTYRGNTGLSNSLGNSYASYNLNKYQAENGSRNGIGIGDAIGPLASLGTIVMSLL